MEGDLTVNLQQSFKCGNASALSGSESKAFTLSPRHMAVSLTDDFPPGGEAVILGPRQREVEGVLEDKGEVWGKIKAVTTHTHRSHCAASGRRAKDSNMPFAVACLWSGRDDLYAIRNSQSPPGQTLLPGPFFLSKSIRWLLRGGHLAQTLNHSYVNLPMIYEAQCPTDSLLILEGSLRWITVTTWCCSRFLWVRSKPHPFSDPGWSPLRSDPTMLTVVELLSSLLWSKLTLLAVLALTMSECRVVSFLFLNCVITSHLFSWVSISN